MPSILPARRRAAALLLVAAVSGSTLAGMAQAARTSEPVRCEIALSRSAGTITLRALAHSETRVSGSYRLRVSGSGSEIRQGGRFEAAPGRTAVLGTVTLGTSGGGYRADLDLDLGDEVLSCSQRIGGGI